MAKIITIETSNSICSAALAIDGKCVALREAVGNEHTHRLTMFVDEILRAEGLNLARDIDAIAVSAGPGSYTGLRIGVATAKGMCFASGKPLIAVGTIDAMCHAIIDTYGSMINAQTTLVGMVDARRMEVYTAMYDHTGARTTPIEAKIIDADSLGSLDPKHTILFGSGAAKCAELLGSPALDVPLSAKWLCGLADRRLHDAQVEDIAYFEPDYIKEFVALTSSKKLF